MRGITIIRVLLGVALGMSMTAANATMGLSPDLGGDLLKYHDQKRPERKDVGRGMNELLLNEVFLKNLMKSNELFMPDADVDSGVDVSLNKHMYQDLVKRALVQYLAKNDSLKLNAALKKQGYQ